MGNQHERQWRCTGCSTLLGVEREGRLHIKYKTARYVVTGAVTAVCRRCSDTNETNVLSVGDAAADGKAA